MSRTLTMIKLRTVLTNSVMRSQSTMLSRTFSAEVTSPQPGNLSYPQPGSLSYPPPSGADKVFSPKIQSLVDEIAKLNLLEVADLNDCLKKTLRIEAVPMAMAGGFAAPAAKSSEDAEEEAPKVVKNAFTVKLVKFDDGKKVALIKEIKNVVEGMNLVQAKKFVESAPQVLRSGVPKDEAEALKKSLEALGAVVELE